MIKKIKQLLKKTFIYKIFKWKKLNKIESRKKGKYYIENRKKESETLVIVLAGFKKFCSKIVFDRLNKFCPEEYDVCIVSAGKKCEYLSNIAKQNNWSYLSTKSKNISKALNISINAFKNAKYIFKIDEDIFVTKNFFSSIVKTFNIETSKKGLYKPGFITPLININGFSSYYVLKKLNLYDKYSSMFENIKIVAGPNELIEKSEKVAKFMWGENDIVPSIDEIDNIFNKNNYEAIPCPIRFSIGAIFFTRQTWIEMNYFDVCKGVGLGLDEWQVCDFAISNSRPIIVSQNTLVGHLGFGQQNKYMKDYYINNIEKFSINEY